MKESYNHMKKINALLFFCSLFLSSAVNGQGWDINYGPISNETVAVLETMDGGFVSAGLVYGNDSENGLTKMDADGNLLWQQTYNDQWSEHPADLMELNDGGFVILGSTQNPNGGKVSSLFIRTDALGNEIWKKFMEIDYPVPYTLTGSYGQSITIADDGNPVFSILLAGDGFNYCHVIKTDLDGNQIWATTYDQTVNARPVDIVNSLEGGFLLLGKKFYNSAGEFYHIKLDEDGLIQSVDSFQTSLFFIDWKGLIQDQDSNYVSIGRGWDGNFSNHGIIAKHSVNGDSLWVKNIELGEATELFEIINSTDQESYVVSGLFREQTLDNLAQPFIIKFDKEGEEQWTSILDLPFYSAVQYSVNSTSDLGYIVAGTYDGGAFTIIPGLHMVRMDSLGNAHTNQIEGTVYEDNNLNCLYDNNEYRFNNWLVEAVGAQSFYGLTDTSGNYSIAVDTGTYQIVIHPPSPYWSPCEDSVEVNVISYDTAMVDFPMEALTDCPYLTVDISTSILLYCDSQTYTVNYCNEGTVAATGNVYVAVEIDPLFSVTGASIPITSQVGDFYYFDIPDVDINSCGSFEIYTLLGCDSVLLGQTLCMEAHIYPDSLCLDPLWEGPVIEVTAACVADDSIAFVISNTGGNMTTAMPFIIIEDNILLHEGTFQLDFGTDTTIIIFDNPGSVYHLQAQQYVAYPILLGNAYASVSIASCESTMWLGSINEYLEDDGEVYISMDCQEILGAYDPNDLRVFPAGREEEHFIDANSFIEYHIRFQNTGNYYATKVVIVDPVSDLHDLTTLLPGASSHSYDWELLRDGTIQFIFDDIMLPAISMDEPGSHGFVKFRVAQQPDLQPGTVIHNQAKIFFDNNVPITTNETWLTIMESLTDLIDNVSHITNDELQVAIYPNPLHDVAHFKLTGEIKGKWNFQLYDLLGNEFINKMMTGTDYEFERKDLPSGIYFYKISMVGQTTDVHSGKIIIH